MLTGSYRVGSTLYHARPSGALVTGNGWVRTDGAWYYASPSGALRTGWLKLSGTWYWLDPETGVMATVGIKMDRPGTILTGLVRCLPIAG